ncbi:hypothetical protein BV22DRAFT_1197619 [Leucogyrophana mollusca]|uniref:Uncharacterized protein n=1 Tax=Leucogyrophana mollusca TaxID=85980 RepID=A0ACB8B9P4_9AGAM|nr:hypothetical protein BV22DRAFT_1197619 [Leucogyrophana mollusca]
MPGADASIGALEVGGFVMIYFFGFVTVQTYHYYRKYSGDSTWLRLMVAFVWFFVIAHSISVVTGMYDVSVTRFGQQSAETLSPAPPGFAWSILFAGFLPSGVQGFFTYRVYIFSKQIYIPVFCWTICFLRFLGTVAVAVDVIAHHSSFQRLEKEMGWVISAVLIMGVANDVAVTGSMCYYLKREKASVNSTIKILDRLIAYTIGGSRNALMHTNVLTVAARDWPPYEVAIPALSFAEPGIISSIVISLTSLATFFCFKLMTNYAWFAIYLFSAEVNANALLANLNARKVHSAVDQTLVDLSRITYSGSTGASRTAVDLSSQQPQHTPPSISKDDVQSNTTLADEYNYPNATFLEPSFAPNIAIEVCRETQTDLNTPKDCGRSSGRDTLSLADIS